jgi:hypothetical protein
MIQFLFLEDGILFITDDSDNRMLIAIEPAANQRYSPCIAAAATEKS